MGTSSDLSVGQAVFAIGNTFGFAVPVDVVNRVVPKLITNGKVPRPGIGIIILDEEVAAGLGVLGVVIDRVVPGSEANRVGLQGID